MGKLLSYTKQILQKEHTMELDELEKYLMTKVKRPDNATDKYQGLTQVQAEELLKKYGPNQLSEKKGLPWYIVFLLRMTGPFNYLMWAGSVLCFVGYGLQEDKTDKASLYLGIVLILIVVVTAIFAHF